jgi:ankyrin repeat protein
MESLKSTDSLEEQFTQACAEGRHDDVDSLLNAGHLPSSGSFAIACREGDLDLVLKLLKFDVDAQKGLFKAVKYSHFHLLDHLYMYVDINRQKKHGATALHFATDVNVVKWLLDMGAKCIPDNAGRTPLHVVCREGSLEVAKMLLNHTPEQVNSCDILGNTPLKVAHYCGNNEIANLFLQHVVTQPPICERTWPLHTACRFGSAKLVKIGIKHLFKTDITAVDADGNIPLHIACRYGHVKVVKTLLKYSTLGTNSNLCRMPNKNGDTPLHLACYFHGNIEIVKLLLPFVHDHELFNDDGDTPLHLACMHGRSEVVKLLLLHIPKHMARIPNNHGYTPSDLAANYPKVLKLLHPTLLTRCMEYCSSIFNSR